MFTPVGNTRLLAGLATAIAALLASALATVPATAAPPGPTATEITSIVVGSTEEVPETRGGTGLVYVERGESFDVRVTFDAPLSWNKDTDLLLKVTNGPEAGRTFGAVVPAESAEGTFSGIELQEAANDVVLQVSVNARRTEVLPAATDPFDVLRFADTYPEPGSLTSISSTTSASGVPCVATPAEPVCADLLLPPGAAKSPLLVSSGVCDGDCVRAYIQILVGLDVTPESPATLVMKCDKTACGGGGVVHQELEVALAPTDPPQAAQPCAEKGVATPEIGEDPYCVDYVQSTRDNAGDTFLYLLFVVDAKVRFL